MAYELLRVSHLFASLFWHASRVADAAAIVATGAGGSGTEASGLGNG